MSARIERALIPEGKRVQSTNFNDYIVIPDISKVLL